MLERQEPHSDPGTLNETDFFFFFFFFLLVLNNNQRAKDHWWGTPQGLATLARVLSLTNIQDQWWCLFFGFFLENVFYFCVASGPSFPVQD